MNLEKILKLEIDQSVKYPTILTPKSINEILYTMNISVDCTYDLITKGGSLDWSYNFYKNDKKFNIHGSIYEGTLIITRYE